ncbi:uncharacterized protein LOC127732202 isoform X1 [Mytilus californianus]|uniref:uncharacterized protein LOC127732202 isoform X1 n=1 Tax=Mytilus californianus TaxID=6549 RepID=UPI00224799FA|nr:uncharacterized protein LOC127732202 isoform X1 [Mytilus californianus]
MDGNENHLIVNTTGNRSDIMYSINGEDINSTTENLNSGIGQRGNVTLFSGEPQHNAIPDISLNSCGSQSDISIMSDVDLNCLPEGAVVIATMDGEIEQQAITLPTGNSKDGNENTVAMAITDNNLKHKVADIDVGTQVISVPIDMLQNMDGNDGQVITIPTEYTTLTEGEHQQVITVPTDYATMNDNDSGHFVTVSSEYAVTNEDGLGQVITIPTDSVSAVDLEKIISMQSEGSVMESQPQIIYVLSKTESEIDDEGNNTSFVAVVPESTEDAVTIASNQIEDERLAYVALTPDSTQNALPISFQEEDCTLSLKELSARERSRLIKRAQRQNTVFREKERGKVRKSMQDKRKDPAYRELERKKDRERRRLSRLTNASLREKERLRDREYKRRQKIDDIKIKNKDDDLQCDSLVRYMNDMDEKCQLTISCKLDDSLEDNMYSFNDKSSFDEDLQTSSLSVNGDRTDLIDQYGDSVLQSDILSDKDSDSRHFIPFIT